MDRRSPGEGSVYGPRKDGRYVACLTVAPGERKYAYAKTRPQARKKLSELRAAYEAGRLVGTKDQTVRDYLRYWLDDLKRHQIAPTTYTRYEQSLGHIVPSLGALRLGEVTPDHVNAAYSAILSEGIHPNTLRTYHTILASAFKRAVDTGKLSRNPVSLSDPPKVQPHPWHALTPDEVDHFLDMAVTHPHRDLFELLVSTGLRLGEALALRWEHVDLERSHLHVRYTVRAVSGEGLIEGDPKTKKSRRTITIPELVVETLAARKQATGGAHPRALVFPNTSGTYLAQQTVREVFGRVVRDAKLSPLRIHDLRHTFATIALHELGIPVKQVSEMLGHANIGITLEIYGHVLPTMHEDAARKMDALLRRRKHERIS